MIKNCKNPKWSDAAHSSIILDAMFIGCNGEEEIWEEQAFVAAPNDCTSYGPMLFNFAVNGIFGKVADSDEERILSGEIPPPQGFAVKNGEIVNLMEIEAGVRAEFDRRSAAPVCNCFTCQKQAFLLLIQLWQHHCYSFFHKYFYLAYA